MDDSQLPNNHRLCSLAIAKMLTHDQLFTYNWFVLLSTLSLTPLTDSLLTMYCLKNVFVCFNWGLYTSMSECCCYKNSWTTLNWLYNDQIDIANSWSTICFLTRDIGICRHMNLVQTHKCSFSVMGPHIFKVMLC